MPQYFTTHRLAKGALSTALSLSTMLLPMSLPNASSLALAKENESTPTTDAPITIMETSDKEVWVQLQSRQQALQTEKASYETQQQTLATEKVYWGRYDYGEDNNWRAYDGTWDTLWGFVIPGISQLVTVFDGNAPAWLRWTEGAQLVSLGVLSIGGFQLFEKDLLGRPAPFPTLTDRGANGMFYGGLGAYTALALVPSTIVSIHDGINGPAHDNKVSANQDALNRINQELADLAIPLEIYTLATGQDYAQALEKVNALSSDQVNDYQLHFERLKQWKQKVFDAEYAAYQSQSLGTEARLQQLKVLAEHPYISTRPAIQTQINQQLPALQQQWEQEQATANARAQALAAEQERQAIFDAAYALAADGEFYEAQEKLKSYDWKPEHAQYARVQEKLNVWNNAWFSDMYKFAYDRAGHGDIERALEVMWSLGPIWPKDHPDYKRVLQKTKEWENIYNTRRKMERKSGFLNKGQVKLLKEKGYPVIMPSMFPNANTWRFMVYTQSAYNQYSIFYYDTKTRKSFSVIGGQLCGDLSSTYYRQVIGKPQQVVKNPVLGSVGLVSLGYADAYLTTDLRKDSNVCYTVVTPGNLESWMVTDEEAPASLERLTKAEFIQVIQSLKYLP